MTKTVIGIFNDSTAAQTAYERLTARGFAQDEIDITNPSGGQLMADERVHTDHSGDDFGDRVSRFFKNLFDDEEDSETFTSAAKTGTVVSVYTDSSEQAQTAADILDESGAIDVNDRVNENEFDTGEDRPTRGIAGEGDFNRDGSSSNRSIPIVEEELKVGKREVETGGMRLRSRIIDRPVEESLRLRQERVTLERTPVNRPATESDLNTFRDGEIEVRERAEVPVVNKEARVVEEIKVRKDVEEREEVVRDTVRKTDVEVDNIEGDKETSGNKSRPRRKV